MWAFLVKKQFFARARNERVQKKFRDQKRMLFVGKYVIFLVRLQINCDWRNPTIDLTRAHAHLTRPTSSGKRYDGSQLDRLAKTIEDGYIRQCRRDLRSNAQKQPKNRVLWYSWISGVTKKHYSTQNLPMNRSKGAPSQLHPWEARDWVQQ